MSGENVQRLGRRVQVRFWTDADPRERVGYTKNVSERGVFVATSRPFQPGTRVEMDLMTADQTYRACGRVVHAAKVSPLLQSLRASGMGIRLEARNPLVDWTRAGSAPVGRAT